MTGVQTCALPISGPRAEQIPGENSAEEVTTRPSRDREVEHLRGEDECTRDSHQDRLPPRRRIAVADPPECDPNHQGGGSPQRERHLRGEESVGDVKERQHGSSLSQLVAISRGILPPWSTLPQGDARQVRLPLEL